MQITFSEIEFDFFCHTLQRQIFCANIIDVEKNCYKSSSKVNFSHFKVYKKFSCNNYTYVEYSIFILEVSNTTIEYWRIFFPNIQKQIYIPMCTFSTMCGLNPTHHPGMHSHNVWYIHMLTVGTVWNCWKICIMLKLNRLYIIYICV